MLELKCLVLKVLLIAKLPSEKICIPGHFVKNRNTLVLIIYISIAKLVIKAGMIKFQETHEFWKLMRFIEGFLPIFKLQKIRKLEKINNIQCKINS